MRKNLLITTLKIFSFWGLGAPRMNSAGGLRPPDPLWFCAPHAKPLSAAFGLCLFRQRLAKLHLVN